jgi:hypothetical protein
MKSFLKIGLVAATLLVSGIACASPNSQWKPFASQDGETLYINDFGVKADHIKYAEVLEDGEDSSSNSVYELNCKTGLLRMTRFVLFDSPDEEGTVVKMLSGPTVWAKPTSWENVAVFKKLCH